MSVRSQCRGPGRSLAAAQGIRTNDEVFVGIDGPSRADQAVPPTDAMRISGERVADQNGVGASRIERPPGFVANDHARKGLAAFENEIADLSVVPLAGLGRGPLVLLEQGGVNAHGCGGYPPETGLD